MWIADVADAIRGARRTTCGLDGFDDALAAVSDQPVTTSGRSLPCSSPVVGFGSTSSCSAREIAISRKSVNRARVASCAGPAG
jgi:hypothetical protein